MDKIFEQHFDDVIEDIVSHIIEAYWCYDWNLSIVEFACDISEQIKEQLLIYADKLDNPDDE